MKTQSILADRLKEIRKKSGFTQKQISEKLNIEIGTLSGYETGRRKPNTEMLTEIAKLYDVTTDYLLGAIDPSHLIPVNKVLTNESPNMISLCHEHHKNISQLSHDELLLIEKYRSMSNEDKDNLQKQTQTIAAHRTDNPMDDLPPEAQERVNEFIELMRIKHGKKNV